MGRAPKNGSPKVNTIIIQKMQQFGFTMPNNPKHTDEMADSMDCNQT